MVLESKITQLQTVIKSYGSVLVAFSGGVDSSLLLKIAVDTLGERVAAFTAASPLHHSDTVAVALSLVHKFPAGSALGRSECPQ